MHCLTAWGQWAVQFLQCTASLPGGSEAVQLLQCTATSPGGGGQWDSCNTFPPCLECNSRNALPHRLGAVGSGTLAMHGLTARGQWAVLLPLCTASLLRGSGQWNSCNALPRCLGAVGTGHCYSCCAVPHSSGAVGSGTPAMHCRIAWGQWAVELVQYTASLPRGSGQCNFCYVLPNCPGAVGNGPSAMCGPLRWGTGSRAHEAVSA